MGKWVGPTASGGGNSGASSPWILTRSVTDFRHLWKLDHQRLIHVLHWHHPGAVWAMDHAEPPRTIDGRWPCLVAFIRLTWAIFGGISSQTRCLPVKPTGPRPATPVSHLFFIPDTMERSRRVAAAPARPAPTMQRPAKAAPATGLLTTPRRHDVWPTNSPNLDTDQGHSAGTNRPCGNRLCSRRAWLPYFHPEVHYSTN
jgi:hypothetical protein